MPSLSTYGVTHPPRSNPPLRSSSGPPRPCITPSTETMVVVVSFMVAVPFSLVSQRRLIAFLGEDRVDLAEGLRQAFLRAHGGELLHRLDGRKLALDRHPGLPAVDRSGWSPARSSSGARCWACRPRSRSHRGRRADVEAGPRPPPRTRAADRPPGRSCGTRRGRRGAGREHRPSQGRSAAPTSARAGADRPRAARPAPARRRTRPPASSCATKGPFGRR